MTLKNNLEELKLL